MLANARAVLLNDLRSQMGRIEGAGRNSRRVEAISTGFEALDQLLPRGGLAAGALIEWLGDGRGAFTLALAVGGFVARERGMLAIVGGETFFPPAAAALGVPLDRTVIVRPGDSRLTLWAWEQALRCEGLAVALGRLPRVGDSVARRLQLAAETGGGLGFLIRPDSCRHETSWAEARLLVRGVGAISANDAASPAWRLRVELLRCRGGFGGGAAQVELSHEADDVPLAAELADPASAD